MADLPRPASLDPQQQRHAAKLLRFYLGSAYRLTDEEIPVSLPTFGMREIRLSVEAPPPMPDIERGLFAVPVKGAKGPHSDPTAQTAIALIEPGRQVLRVPAQMLVPRRDVAGAIAALPTHQQVALSRVVIAGQGGADVARAMRLGKTTINDWADQALLAVCAMLYGEYWGEIAA